MVKIKILFTIALISLFAFRLWQASGCEPRSFLFNPKSITVNVESQTLIDRGLNRQVSRIFHNKISAGLYESGIAYLQLFEPIFLLSFLGPLGIILSLIAFSKLIHKRDSFSKLGLILITGLSFFPLKFQSKIFLYLLFSAWYFFAYSGVAAFTKNPKTRIIFLILFFLTLYFFNFYWQMKDFCSSVTYK